MVCKPEKKTGISRVWAAFFYSISGLRYAAANEAAFRQELLLVIGLSITLLFLPISITLKILLFFATSLVLVVELLNSAIESIVDLASPKYHILAKRAKDFGSAAVLISIFSAMILWIAVIYLQVF